MATHILGITAYRNDSAAALIRDGAIVAAAREESFSRRRGDGAFPASAIQYCLREAQRAPGAIDLVVFCDLLQSGGGLRSLVTALRRTQLQVMLRRELSGLIGTGLHALPPLALVTRSEAAAEVVDLVEPCAALANGDSLWHADGACAVGAALHGWHRQLDNTSDKAASGAPWFGPWYGAEGIRAWLDELGVTYRALDEEALVERAAQQLADGAAVGWLQGRLEFCARSLGGRSILAEPRLPLPKQLPERPLVGLTLDPARASGWLRDASRQPLRARLNASGKGTALHVVEASCQPRLHRLLQRTLRADMPLLLSADFCGDEEPLVTAPIDAYRCFMLSELDCLVMENLLLFKAEQPLWEERAG